MATHYKPTEYRGKFQRVVFRSFDPDEPRREKVWSVIILLVFIICLAALWFVENRLA